MKRFITFGSIGQFRNIVKDIGFSAQYVGMDEEENEAIFDKTATLPTIKAIGTEKIHGTNAGVCFSNSDGFWVQSRKNIISEELDNADCALVVNRNKEIWMEIISALALHYKIDLDKEIISVYFEWSGGNIQKKSALSGLDKRAMIFQYFKVSPLEPQLNSAGEEISARWLETKTSDYVDHVESNIFNIMNFPKIELTIDFNRPAEAQNKMIELVESLEKNSKVGQAFGIEENVGEGYVFTLEFKENIHRFKVKGEAHAKGSGRVKVLSPADEELENRKIEFVNNIACKEFRLEQMYNEVFDTLNGGEGDIKRMSDYLRAVVNDVLKEELDLMEEQELTPKMVNGMISKVARGYMLSRVNEV